MINSGSLSVLSAVNNVNTLNIGKEILGVIIALIVISLIYLITMAVYFALKKKWADRRVKAEVFVVIGALLLSFIIRFCVLSADENWSNDNSFGINKTFYTIYTVISGLSFESYDLASSSLSPFLVSAYYFTLLYTGLVALSVITVKISYEFYSLIRLRIAIGKAYGKVLGKFFGKDSVTDLYIFTDVSQKALILADDINRQYYDFKNGKRARLKKSGNNEKHRRAIIIFAGPNIGPLDRKNELHRQIIQNDYFYFSYDSDDIALIKKLKLTKIRNNPYLKDYKDSYIRIIAMADGDENVDRDINCQTVFNDMRLTYPILKEKFDREEAKEEKREKRLMAKEMKIKNNSEEEEKEKKQTKNTEEVKEEDNVDKNIKGKASKEKHCPLIIDYYIDAISRINYEYIDSLEKEIVKEKTLRNNIVIHCFAEDMLAAYDMAGKREKAFLQYEKDTNHPNAKWEESLFYKDIETCNKKSENRKNSNKKDYSPYSVAILGFDSVSEKAMHMLFELTTYLFKENTRYVPLEFNAKIYDAEANKKSGVFAYSHPLYNFTHDENEGYNTAQSIMVKAIKSSYKCNVSTDRFKSKLKAFPRAEFFQTDVRSIEFLKGIDRVIGNGAEVSGNNQENKNVKAVQIDRNANAILINIGNDEENIELANAIIDDFRHEMYNTSAKSKYESVQTIYIYLRNAENYKRINWSEDDCKRALEGTNKLFVICFGSYQSIYTYNNVIDDAEAKEYHWLYSVAAKLFSNTEYAQEFKGNENDFQDIAEKIYREDDKKAKMQKAWLSAVPFHIESNKALAAYDIVFQKILKKKKLTNEEIKFLINLEKARWASFYIGSGWIYAGYEKEEKVVRRNAKEHDGLFFLTQPQKNKYPYYDYINIVLNYYKLHKEK